jgi:uncharacterized protein (DUF1778 family)
MDKQKKRGGRPPKSSGQKQTESLDVRLTMAEKRAFREAAEVAGMPLSAWVRERLRRIARTELEEAKRPVAFMTNARG